MANKGSKDCCCTGCEQIPADIDLPSGAIQTMQQYCCRCIPNVLCVTVTDEGGTPSTQVLFRTCSSPPVGEEPILYFGSWNINGTTVQVNFRLLVEDGRLVNSPVDYFCDDLTTVGSAPRDFRGYGTTSNATPAIYRDAAEGDVKHAAVRFENINLEQDECLEEVLLSLKVNSAIGSTARVRIYAEDAGDASELPTGDTVADLNTLTKTALYVEHDITIPAAGNSLSLNVTSLVEHIIAKTSWASGNAINLIVETQSFGSDPMEIVFGAVQDDTPFLTVTTCDDTKLCYFSWDSDEVEAYESQRIRIDHSVTHSDPYCVEEPCTQSASQCCSFAFDFGEMTSALGGFSISVEKGDTKDLKYKVDCGNCNCICRCICLYVTTFADGVQTSVICGEIIDGEMVWQGVDYSVKLVKNYTTGCCELQLSDYYGNKLAANIAIDATNDCPNPVAEWNLDGDDGNPIQIYFTCAFCDNTCGGVIVECCDNPIPRVVTASATHDCYGGCADYEMGLIIDGASGSIWEGSLNTAFCDGPAELTLSCGGGSFGLTGSGGPCTLSATLVSSQCNPLRLEFDVTYIGIGCCGPGISGASGTIIITE